MFALLGDYRKLVVHLRKVHNKTVREYKMVHDYLNIIDTVRHHCKICSKDILYTWDHLQMHLKLNHGTLKVSEYVDYYLDKEDMEPVKLIRSKDDCKGKQFKKPLKEEDGLCKNKTQAQDKDLQGIDCGVGRLEVTFSDTPYDYCVYGCQECYFKGNHCHVLMSVLWIRFLNKII